MPEPTLVLRSAELDWRMIEGDVVALDLKRSEYGRVNATGTVLWAALAEGATRSALIEMLLDRFEVTRDQAEADVGSFLQALEAHQLLDGRESAS